MKTAIKPNRSAMLAGAAATLALAAMGFANSAQARDNVYWSVGVGTPGAVVNVGNVGSVYPYPQPVYVQPAPVYVQPAPVYVQPRVVYPQPQPIYYGQPYGHHKHHKHHKRHDGGYYMQAPGPGYAPVYYPRDSRNDGHYQNRHDDRNDWRDGRR